MFSMAVFRSRTTRRSLVLALVFGPCLAQTAQAVVVHQYTFNDGNANDSVGTADGTVINPEVGRFVAGQFDATANNGQQSNDSPQTGTYIDLPNNIVSSAFIGGQNLAATFETWITVEQNRTWSSAWDFGTSDGGEDTSNGANNASYMRLMPLTGPGDLAIDTHLASGGVGSAVRVGAPLSTGVQHHLVVTIDQFDTSAGLDGTVNMYVNGGPNRGGDLLTGPVALGLFLDLNFFDDNNWLGRTQWNDPLFDGSYDEFRIYDNAINQSDVESSFDTGPVPAPASPILTVNRDSGGISISSSDGSDLDLVSYSILSDDGALDPTAWTSIADSNANWTESSATSNELAEAGTSPVVVNTASLTQVGNVWTRSPFEDISFNFQLEGETTMPGLVEYSGTQLTRSDLNADGAVDRLDYAIFVAGNFADLSGQSPVEAYLQGDLNGDGENNNVDFRVFQTDFDAINGVNAFARMISGALVPEPTTLAMVLCCCLAYFGFRRHRRLFSVALCVLCLVAVSGPSMAAEVHRYTFNGDALDSIGSADGTVVDPTGNIATYTQGGRLSFAANDGQMSDQGGTDFTDGGYLDLPNGTISALGDVGSFELWVTASTNRNWAEIFSFGAPGTGLEDTSTGQGVFGYITLIPDTGNAANTLSVHHFPPGGPNLELNAPTNELLTPGIEYHIVSVVDKNDTTAGADGTAYLYRDGQLLGSGALDVGFSLGGLTDVNNWLGRSQWNDPLFDGSYNEFRIYDHALSAEEVADNFEVGAEVPQVLELEVNTLSGNVRLNNISASTDVALDFYRITSAQGLLNRDAWNSLDEQNLDAVDGDDPDSTPGDDPSEGWAESGGSDAFGISELFLDGPSMLTAGSSFNLGQAFDFNVLGAGVDGDLAFFIEDPTGETLPGAVTYVMAAGVDGDYNNDGVVGAADYTVWRDALGTAGPLPNDPLGGTIDDRQYDQWKNAFGSSGSGSGLGNTSPVPEPATTVMVLLAGAALVVHRQRRRARSRDIRT